MQKIGDTKMKRNEKRTLANARALSRRKSLRAVTNTKKPKRILLGRHIIADPHICHGKPTFRGTRIMVWQVLEMLAEGLVWESIIEECHNSITEDAIAEAVKLSGKAFLKHANEFAIEAVPA
jgi:uncharacterized protein (DUF433 family)